MANDVKLRLVEQIQEWNINRLDLFHLSEPNQDLEFFGVMRFFYQDEEEKVSTKCIRVSSTATTKDVLDILIEKFRPDLRMLSRSMYALYEVHINGDERKLSNEECPLLVQLHWGEDDREGRFLLKRETDKTTAWSGLGESSLKTPVAPGLERRLSRREKKEQKKRDKEAAAGGGMSGGTDTGGANKENIAKRLYTAAPDSSFTRSISNPEMVMRRRRQMKLERKLQEIHTSSGGPNSGGTLKIYGDNISPLVPYKTLLLSKADCASHVVRETLDKYGLEKEQTEDYCLVQVIHPTESEEFYGQQRKEFILDDDDCPLEILAEMPPTSGPVTFQLRRRPPGTHAPKYTSTQPPPAGPPPAEQLPYLVELGDDGKEAHNSRSFVVPFNGLEFGLEKTPGQTSAFFKLGGPEISRHHCVIVYTPSGAFVVTLLDQSAVVFVDGQRVINSMVLNHGSMLQIGKQRLFRFIDPLVEQKPSRPPATVQQQQQQQQQQSGAGVPLLPATIEYRDEVENELLRAVLIDINVNSLEFKLCPTYVVYMSARHKVLNVPSPNNLQQVASLTNKVTNIIYQVVQRSSPDPMVLAVWMANSSELLHLLSRDVVVGSLTSETQNVLAECVQQSFMSLVDCLQRLLHNVMPAFIDLNPQQAEMPDEMLPQPTGPVVDDVISLLSSTMSLLLRARVNAALTIQLFSQLFHYMNQWLFNRLVARESSLCSLSAGQRILNRLHRIEVWAEKQGLELAAECHLMRILQAAMLLEANKSSPQLLADISSNCYKLNSLQLRALFQNYITSRDEPPITSEFIERAVSIAQSTADVLARKEGTKVKLQEDVDLQLPFLLPEDGYSCDFMTGFPQELRGFVESLERAGICRLIDNHKPQGIWTVYLSKSQNVSGRGAFPVMDLEQQQQQQQQPQQPPQQPPQYAPSQLQPATQLNIITVTFSKVKNSIGLSIIEATGEGQRQRSIYVKSVIPDGAAARDGRVQAGDQLVSVDGHNLVGLTQDQAADLLIHTGQTVTLQVAKQAALYHGLGQLLEQPSPGSVRRDADYYRRDVQQPPQPSNLPPSHSIPPSSHNAPPSHLVPPSMPIYSEPRSFVDNPPRRSRSATNLHHPKVAPQDVDPAWPPAPTPLQAHPAPQSQPQLSSWKSYEGRGQKGLGAEVEAPLPGRYMSGPNLTGITGRNDVGPRGAVDGRQGGPMGGPVGFPMGGPDGRQGGPMGGPDGRQGVPMGGPDGRQGGPMGGPDGRHGGPMGGPDGRQGGPMGGPDGRQGGPMGGPDGRQGGPMGGPDGRQGGPMGGPDGRQGGPMGGPDGRQGGPMGGPDGRQGGPMGGPDGRQGGPMGGPDGRPGGPHGGPVSVPPSSVYYQPGDYRRPQQRVERTPPRQVVDQRGYAGYPQSSAMSQLYPQGSRQQPVYTGPPGQRQGIPESTGNQRGNPPPAVLPKTVYRPQSGIQQDYPPPAGPQGYPPPATRQQGQSTQYQGPPGQRQDNAPPASQRQDYQAPVGQRKDYPPPPGPKPTSQSDLLEIQRQIYTSEELLSRAQPSRHDEPIYANSSGQGGTLERRSIPVGGHLRAIDRKSLQQQPYQLVPGPPNSAAPGPRPVLQTDFDYKPQVYREPQASQPGIPPAGLYPSQSSGPYPPQSTGSYPPQSAGSYPPHSSGPYLPQSAESYPPQSAGSYPSQSTGSYPPQSSGPYPPQSAGSYPSQLTGSYSTQSAGPHTSLPPPVSYPSQPTGSYPAGVARGVTPTLANPWERERREEEQRHQEMEQRQRRDMEISQLESIPADQLIPAEADRLHRLRLSREFERRANEQIVEQTTADNETDMTPAGRAKVVSYLAQEMDDKRRQVVSQQEYNRTYSDERRIISKPPTTTTITTTTTSTDDYYYQQQQQQQQQPPMKQPTFQYQETTFELTTDRNVNNNNANNVVPAPPERTSSHTVYQSADPQLVTGHTQTAVGTKLPQSTGPTAGTKPTAGPQPIGPKPVLSSTSQPTSTKKTVSFHSDVVTRDSSSDDDSPSPPGVDSRYWFTEDPQRTTPDRTLPTSGAPSTPVAPPTPGVVGAQELYPDRGRASHSLAPLPVVNTPERMSFRDKMKHFATEAGEDTPLERAKISRAQQRIEVAGQ